MIASAVSRRRRARICRKRRYNGAVRRLASSLGFASPRAISPVFMPEGTTFASCPSPPPPPPLCFSFEILSLSSSYRSRTDDPSLFPRGVCRWDDGSLSIFELTRAGISHKRIHSNPRAGARSNAVNNILMLGRLSLPASGAAYSAARSRMSFTI